VNSSLIKESTGDLCVQKLPVMKAHFVFSAVPSIDSHVVLAFFCFQMLQTESEVFCGALVKSMLNTTTYTYL
jgi:hypothetical protein